MSTIHSTNNNHNDTHRNDTHRNDGFESVNPREQLLGMLVLTLVLLFAIVLRSM